MGGLGIIAGGGELPRAIAESACANGREVFVVALEKSGGWTNAFPHDRSSMGLVGRTLKLLREHGCREMVFAGYVDRPNFFKLRYDLKGLSWFPPVLWAMRKGDNTLLDAMVGLFAREGITVLSIGDVAPWLQVPPGPLGRVEPTADDVADIAFAIATARMQGTRDVGQAVVVRDGKVLAVEDRDGTDAMLTRLGKLPKGRGVLAKALKPMQNRKSDLPTIGVATVKNAAACGLAGIAIEAHTALVLDKPEVARTADALGLFVTAVPAPVAA
ncbi:MAG: UDP-2,3-diacylglucosamine diphosphatase LpxI [Proteobacteria bacterium]|nr:UDP-2,3-diacylglucosamine diphosphatase LpxI [Pseudomonadota bacterium]